MTNLRLPPTHWCWYCGLVYWGATLCTRCPPLSRRVAVPIPEAALAAYLLGGQSAVDVLTRKDLS